MINEVHNKLERLTKWSNGAVLLSSIMLIVITSIETLSMRLHLSQHFILNFQLIVCSIFIIDFVVRMIPHNNKPLYVLRNIFMLIVSVPYLNIVVWSDVTVSKEAHLLLRSIPLIRGIYGLVIIINWITKNKISNLFYSYLITMLSATYYASIIFYSIEKGINPMVKEYWDALWWACMNFTTVGSNIFGVTFFGQLLAPLLAGVGMMMFPIFTVYITTRYDKQFKMRTKKTE